MMKGVQNNRQQKEEVARKAQNRNPLTQTHTLSSPLTTLRNIPQMSQNRHEQEDATDNTPFGHPSRTKYPTHTKTKHISYTPEPHTQRRSMQ